MYANGANIDNVLVHIYDKSVERIGSPFGTEEATIAEPISPIIKNNGQKFIFIEDFLK